MTFRRDENAKPCPKCRSSWCQVTRLLLHDTTGMSGRTIEKWLTEAQDECDRERTAKVNAHTFTIGNRVRLTLRGGVQVVGFVQEFPDFNNVRVRIESGGLAMGEILNCEHVGDEVKGVSPF